MKAGIPSRLAVVSGAVVLAAGCGQSTVRISPGPRINTYGLPASETSGRLLQVAVISISPHHYPRINQTELFRNAVVLDDPSPLGALTAKKWFLENGDDVLRPIISEPNAIQTVVVEANKPMDVRVRPPSWKPFAKGGGILVLANFNGLGTEPSIQSDVWVPKSTFGGKIVVDVGETSIRRH